MKTCTACTETFSPDDSLGSDFDLCQGCWESHCSETWWEQITAIAEAVENAEVTFARGSSESH